MQASQLQPNEWYWIRRKDGTLVPYRFHQLAPAGRGENLGEFFVGSMVETMPLAWVVGEAKMPRKSEASSGR